MHLVTFERREPRDASDRDERRLSSMADEALGFETLEPLRPGARRLGAVVQLGRHAGSVVDLNRALAIKLAFEDVGAPEAEAESLVPSEMLAFLRRLPLSLEAAQSALAFAVDALERYDGPDLLSAGVVERPRRVRLCAPVPRPGKVLAVARNYPDGASDERPEAPAFYLEAPSAVIGPEDEIALPAACERVAYEGELAVVIGTRARALDAAEALACVAGYCVANDVSARDFGNEPAPHSIDSSCDSFAPLGPELVTADEIADPQDLAIHTSLSGERVQSGRTKEMWFPIVDLIASASARMTLEPGDVLLTGAPAGAARKPPRWLRDGDVVEVAVERVGRLRNYVRAERASGSGA